MMLGILQLTDPTGRPKSPSTSPFLGQKIPGRVHKSADLVYRPVPGIDDAYTPSRIAMRQSSPPSLAHPGQVRAHLRITNLHLLFYQHRLASRCTGGTL